MNTNDINLIKLINAMNDKPIAFNKHYVKIGCSINAALMLSQMQYWSQRTKHKDGFFYKTQIEWEQETGLSRKEQETARKKLRQLGFVVEKKQGIPCKTYYKVLPENIYNALIDYAEQSQTSLSESYNQECINLTPQFDLNSPCITENTQENTTERIWSDQELSTLLKDKDIYNALVIIGLNPDIAKRFIQYRNYIKKPLTIDAVIMHYRQSIKAKISTDNAASIVLIEGWKSFYAHYSWESTYSDLKDVTEDVMPIYDEVADAEWVTF